MSRVHDIVDPSIMGDETSMHALFINNPRTVISPREFEQMLLSEFATRKWLSSTGN